MSNVTVEEAFEAAIGAERAAENLFRGLEAKFSNHEDVCKVWHKHVEDEIMHAKWLEALKAKLSQEELTKVVDDHTVKLLESVAQISVEKALKSVHDLEDAYELVTEIENGETNAIFRFLMDNFEPDEKMRDFLRGQLNMHVTRLTVDMPLQYRGVVNRQSIKVSA